MILLQVNFVRNVFSDYLRPIFGLVQPKEGECYHCGEPLEATVIESDGKFFCCNGCAQVYLFIHESGNDNYYAFRDSLPKEKPSFQTQVSYELLDEKLPKESDGTKSAYFILEGLHCASCVWLNEKILSQIPGVLVARVSFANGRVFLQWNPAETNLKAIGDELLKAGYRLRPVESRVDNRDQFRLLKKMGLAGFFAGNIMLISTSLYAGNFSGMDWMTRQVFYWLSWAMATPVLFYSASEFYRRAWNSLKNGVLSMDLLTSLGLTLAYVYSLWAILTKNGEPYFDAVCFITFAVLAGRTIEDSIRKKYLFESENLAAAMPASAHWIKNSEGDTAERLLQDIKPGDKILVNPGELVPLDGILQTDSAKLDESVITGESLPLPRKKGDMIYAGSVCVEKPIVLLVEKPQAESTLQKIDQMAQEALSHVQNNGGLLERVAKLFILFVIIAASATALWWSLVQHAPIDKVVIYTIAVLIVACPCALTLSVPVVQIMSLKRAYKKKILIKSENALTEIASANHIFFDKTGTLTEGEMSIVSTELFSEAPVNALEIARSIEKAAGLHSPIARAFTQGKANSSDLQIVDISFQNGRGVRANVNNQTFYLGSEGWLMSLGFSIPPKANRDHLTPVYLGKTTDGKSTLLARFLLGDSLREGIKETIAELKKKYTVHLLSGDKNEVCEHIAKQLEIDSVFSERNPEEKKKILEAHVPGSVMVGDGINDSGALAVADCGISFARLSEISASASDVLLLQPEARAMTALFHLAEKSRRILLQNLSLSFLYNATLIPVAFLGYISPFFGAIFMSISSISVLLNALRIK